MKYLIIISVLGVWSATFINAAIAQNTRFDIEGVVTDTLDAELAGATVVLLQAEDSTIVSFGTTRADGLFKLRRVKTGAYLLQITFIGFEAYSMPLSVEEEALNLGRIPLRTAVNELDDLVITADHIPISINRDTLEYNANAFQMRANASVEDLLKRLPGVDVERDGTIRAQGEEVEQVLVDGKEFFGNDPRIATQNLPADAVDKVQVYDRQSDMAEFSGIDDGEESKTINLALKEDSKKGYFGNASGGYGSDEFTGRYEGKASINRFSPSTQLSFIGNLNNVNQQGFSFNDFMSFMGDLSAGGGLLVNGDIPINMGVGDGFTRTTAAGINWNRDFSSNTSLQSSYFLNLVDNEQNRGINQQQLISAERASSSFQSSAQNLLTENHRLNLNFQHTINEGQDLRMRANLRLTDSDLLNDSFREISDANGALINDNNTLYGSDGLEFGGNASLTYRKLLSERGRTLVAESRINWSDGSAKSDLETLSFFYENAGNIIFDEELRQFQSQLNTSFSNRQRIAWTEPLYEKSYLQLNAERREVTQSQEKGIFDIIDGASILNEPLSAGLEQTYTYHNAGMDLRFSPGIFSFAVGAEIQSSGLLGEVADTPQALKRNFVDLLPTARVTFDPNNGKRMELRYQTSTREPSMNELQPFADNADPLFVYVGNPNLEPEYRHTGSAHFMLFDQFAQINVFGFFRAQFTQNRIARSRTIDEQLRQTITSVNVDGDVTLQGRLDYGMPIRPLGLRVNLSANTMYNNTTEFINDESNDARILRQND